jgi:hypothetical protein
MAIQPLRQMNTIDLLSSATPRRVVSAEAASQVCVGCRRIREMRSSTPSLASGS